MRRRDFIAGLGGAAAWPLAARAQPNGRVRRIGVLIASSEIDQEAQARLQTFRQSLADLGWVEGHEVRIDVRWAGPDVAQQHVYARELIALTPDLLLTNATTATQALREATQAIPIVFVTLFDPIRSGVVSNLARPDANVTGFTQYEPFNDVLKQRDAKLAEAQQAQADLIKKQRELDDAKREMDLTIQKQVQAELGTVRDQAKQEAEAALTLRVREKEEQIASMQRQIEDLRRKAEQGSQQLQGEVQELALEALLRQKFPRDVFEPVPKGEFGGDLVQRVVGPAGQVCGSILWEAKRTKNWSDGWLGKVREDQRAAKADVALIVSHALPKGLQTFDQIDGVWVSEPRCAVAVAIVLRESLIALAAARQAGEGQQTKMEVMYQYLTGPRFRHRIEAVVERFSDMQADLDRERKTMMRLWAKREEQIRGVVESTAGLYGDLQGIAGRSLLEIDGLELPLLDGPAVDAAE